MSTLPLEVRNHLIESYRKYTAGQVYQPIQRLSVPAGANKILFTPFAWAKLNFCCSSVASEMSAMAITAKNNPLLVIDLKICKQRASGAYVDVDENDYADVMARLCDPTSPDHVEPINCQRIWIHTHPAGLLSPSGTDEETFRDSYGACDWAVMFIMAKGGGTYAQMRIKVQGLGDFYTFLSTEVCADIPFPAADPAEWKKELDEKVQGLHVTPSYDFLECCDATGEIGTELSAVVPSYPPAYPPAIPTHSAPIRTSTYGFSTQDLSF